MAAQPDRLLAVVSMAAEFARTDESFFRHSLRMLPNPGPILREYITMRSGLLDLVQSMVSHIQDAEENQQEPELHQTLHIAIPASNWDDPVPVRPNNEQIDAAMIPIPDTVELTNCAICQDAITSRATDHAVELRTCHHQFHSQCIHTWWGHSVRCPVCRNDIREAPDN